MWKVTIRSRHDSVSVVVNPEHNSYITIRDLLRKKCCYWRDFDGRDVGKILLDVYDHFDPLRMCLGQHVVLDNYANKIGEIEIIRTEEVSSVSEPVWTTRIVIGIAAEGAPFELVVRNDCLSREYVLKTIGDYIVETDGDRNVLTVFRHCKFDENFSEGYYPVRVAGTQIGAVILTREKIPCFYGARIMKKVTKYKATLNLESGPYTWENIITVGPDGDPSAIMREVVSCSKMRGIPEATAKAFKMIAKLIPDHGGGGYITFAGVVVGSYSIKECNDTA